MLLKFYFLYTTEMGVPSVLSRHIFLGRGVGEFLPQTSNFSPPPRTWGEVCYYVNVIPVSLLSAQN